MRGRGLAEAQLEEAQDQVEHLNEEVARLREGLTGARAALEDSRGLADQARAGEARAKALVSLADGLTEGLEELDSAASLLKRAEAELHKDSQRARTALEELASLLHQDAHCLGCASSPQRPGTNHLRRTSQAALADTPKSRSSRRNEQWIPRSLALDATSPSATCTASQEEPVKEQHRSVSPSSRICTSTPPRGFEACSSADDRPCKAMGSGDQSAVAKPLALSPRTHREDNRAAAHRPLALSAESS